MLLKDGLQKEIRFQQIKPYWSYKEDLSIINGILLKGERLIIPSSMRKEVLKQLHQAPWE